MSKVFGLTSSYAPVYEDASRTVICYNPEQVDNQNSTWHEVVFYKVIVAKPSLTQATDGIIADINARTDEKILSGFVWNDINVWLSTENQFNFKAAYDLAVQTGGANLPVKFKLGESAEKEPIYHTFSEMAEFTDFYTKAVAYINQCLQEGWDEKDAMDFSPYEAILGSDKTKAGE